MNEPAESYVEQTPEGSWRVRGTRVSLDSVVHAYREGLTPEAIVGEFPSLSLERVHGVIAFYLRNREEVERYLGEQADRREQLRRESEAANRDLLAGLRTRRQTSGRVDPE